MLPLRFDQTHLRRGALFLVNIGTPITVGVWLAQPRPALIAAMAGLVLSFADNDGPLPRRLRLLLLSAACMVVGALAGHALASHPPVFWVFFVLAAFAVGLATEAGREPLVIGRNGVTAFAVAAGIPTIGLHEVAYFAGAVLLNGLSRAVDHALFGPLPRAAAGSSPQAPEGRGGWIRYALAYASAASASLWIGLTLDPVRAVWVVTTTLVVMQPDARASYRRIVERIAGTFVGVIAAWAVISMVQSPWALCLAIVLVAPFIPHHVGNRYWLHTALIALMILLAFDLVDPTGGGINGLLTERLKDMLLGCAMALVGTALAFPRKPEPDPDGGPA
jgi:uncharacterized membrane protein YccC